MFYFLPQKWNNATNILIKKKNTTCIYKYSNDKLIDEIYIVISNWNK